MTDFPDLPGHFAAGVRHRQSLVDAELDEKFQAAACGPNGTSPAATYGYHDGSLLMRDPQSLPIVQRLGYQQRTQRPGQIQNFGALLLVRSAGEDGAGFGQVLAASANSQEVLGIDAHSLLGSDLFQTDTSPFDAATLADLRRCLESEDPAAHAPLLATVRRASCTHSGCSPHVFLIVHITQDGYVIDVEPFSEDTPSVLKGTLQTHSLAKLAVARLQKLCQSPWLQQCQAVCDEVRTLTGYDRVMMYKFHPDQHGEVVAESFSSSVPDRYLGLHFPATDIPQANRNIFMQMRSRMIANVAAPNVKIAQVPDLKDDILLTNSQLRAVAGCHAQYLQNMGVQATLVSTIVIDLPAAAEGNENLEVHDGRPPVTSPLWGLIVCHHYSGPHRVSYDHRAAVEFVGKVFALQLGRVLDAQRHLVEHKLLAAQGAVCDVLNTMQDRGVTWEDGCVASSLFGLGGQAMLRVAGSSGCAMLLNGNWRAVGKCPNEAYLDKIVCWLQEDEEGLRRLSAGGQWGTTNLNRHGFSDAKAVRDTAAGVLAADLRKAGADKACPAVVLWMRGEAIQEWTWAGENGSQAANEANCEMSARKSFQAVRSVVELECVPWSAKEVDSCRAAKLLLQDAMSLKGTDRQASTLLSVISKERLIDLQELSKATNDLRAVIMKARVSIITLDVDLRITDYNADAQDWLSCIFSSDVGERQHLSAYLAPSCCAFSEATFHKALSDGVPPKPLALLFRKPGGGYEETLVFTQIKRTISGEPKGLILICRELTAETLLTKQISARERDCQDIIRCSPCPMFAVDKCGRITLWNDAMAGLCGIGSSETCGKLALGEVFGPKGFLRCVKKDGVSDLLTEMSAAILSVQEPGCAQAETLESQGAIEACFGKGDSNLHVDVALRCHVQLGASGEVVGTFFSVQDLTMPKALEKALALQMASEVAAESTERHISILCHEIRNPVNGIMATVQAMEELVVADHFAIDIADFQDLTMTMLYCTNQLRRTVDSILDINKISEGKLKTSPAPLRPKDVVESVLNKLRKPAQERGLTLLSEINPPSLGNTHLLGDEARIQQILSYFCWNIIDYPRAQKCLRLLVECEDGERPGFKRVFWKVVDPLSDVCREGQQRFTSTLVEQDQAETYKESGLGLSVCRGLAEIMDGSVRCTKLDDSVTFTLELDLEVTAEADSGLLPGDESPVSAPKAPGAGALPAHSPAVSYPESSGRSKDSEVQLAMNSQLPPQRCAEEHQATPSQGYPPQAGAGHRDRQGMEAYVPSNFHRQFGHAHSSNWSCCAIREVVDSASVAVLAQVGDGRTSRQHWGSARVVDGNVGSAIAAAYEDAVDRASSLFTSSSAGSCAAPPARMAPPAPWVWNRVSHPGPLMNAAYAASARQWLFTPAGYTTGMQLKPAPLNEPAAVPPLHVYPAVPSCGAMATPVGRSAPARQETVATQHSATSPQSHLSPAQYVQAQVVDPALETQAATPQGSQHKTPTVSVPRTDSKSDVTSLSSPARHAKSPLLEGRSTPRILAVDDDPINIKMLCRNLVREGLDVTTGEDGRDVVRMCVNEGRRFDLLLLDENMRHMNGSVAAAVLRKHEQHNGLERMPIIATTGNSSSQDILRYVSCGMDGILSKPINMRDLVKNIIAFLECQQKIHEMRQNNRLADICSGSSVVIQDNEIFRESLLFGELEIFGVVKEGMAEAAEKARCMVCNHENESC